MSDDEHKIIIDTEEGETVELTVAPAPPEDTGLSVAPPVTFTRPGDSDWLLMDFVRYANSGLSLPITLMMGGSLVSGTLIGGAQWLERFSELTFDSLKGVSREIAEVLRGNIASYAEIYMREPEEDAPPASFVHLYNAKIYTGGKIVPTEGAGMLWRGRLSEVSGFNLGTLLAG